MYLMLKDTPVLYFDLEEFIVEVIRNDLLPFSLREKSYKSNNPKNMLKNIEIIKSYLSSRVLSLSRDNAKQIYTLFQIPQLNNIDTKVKICLKCKGVSIQDSYWLKDNNSKERFKDVNIRVNKFQEIVDIALNGENPSITVNSICPELTTHGLFRKAWIRQDNELYLLKSDKHINNINTRMEVLASKILQCFNNKINCIEYSGRLRNTSDRKIYVDKCRNFVTDKYSFIEAWEVIEYCNTKGFNFIDYLGYSPDVSSIAVLDYILANTDRHTQNYGFMMDNNTGKIEGIAPLFDFNCALVSDIYNKDASNTLSQMFNNKMTLLETAEIYRNTHRLELDIKKLKKLNSTGYKNIINNVIDRSRYIGVTLKY